MRRQEKEITNREEIDDIIRGARVCRLGLADGNQPYVVPMNFGYAPPYLFFHCAQEGRKLEILKKNAKVCFEFDHLEKLNKHAQACEWGASYTSVIGEGQAGLLSDPEQKRSALACIMAQYSSRAFEFPDDALARTAVIRVEIKTVSGKRAS